MSFRRIAWAVALVLFSSFDFAATPALAQRPAARAAARQTLSQIVDAAAQAELERQEAIGMAVGVVRNGRIVHLKGYGLADREKKTPVTVETSFNWASNSKPLGAVLAMQLAEAGKLDLDADVRTYVPEFPDKGQVITCRQLLCHQGGVVHYSNGLVIPTFRRYAEPLPFTDPIVSLDKFKNSPLIHTPGEKYDYTTHGYILLSAAVQKAGDEPFLDQLRKRIVEPLKMKSLEMDVPYNGQPTWSVGYRKRGDDIVVTREDAHYWKHAGGGYKSNIGDFARWAQGLMTNRLLKEETKREMWQPQPTSDGSPTQYGLGFRIGKHKGRLRVSHGGSQTEARTSLVLDPEKKNAVVVLCNCHYVNIDQMERAISSALEKAGK